MRRYTTHTTRGHRKPGVEEFASSTARPREKLSVVSRAASLLVAFPQLTARMADLAPPAVSLSRK